MNKCEALRRLVNNVKVWPSKDDEFDHASPTGWVWRRYKGCNPKWELMHLGKINPLDNIRSYDWLDHQPMTDCESVFLDRQKDACKNFVKSRFRPASDRIESIARDCADSLLEIKHVIIESPYAGGIYANIDYARKCMRDSLLRGEAPYASHLLYTQADVLDDSIAEERELGINAGFAWKHMQNVLTVFYVDLGISKGMRQAIEHCNKNGLSYEIRFLEGV